jgi:hypothetical protein
MPGEKDFGGFAGHHTEWRQVADGVPRDKRSERLADRKTTVRRPTFARAAAGRHAQTPRARSQKKPRASKSENGNEPPANLADAADDLADACAADGVAKQHEATHRRQKRQHMATADGHLATCNAKGKIQNAN